MSKCSDLTAIVLRQITVIHHLALAVVNTPTILTYLVDSKTVVNVETLTLKYKHRYPLAPNVTGRSRCAYCLFKFDFFRDALELCN